MCDEHTRSPGRCGSHDSERNGHNDGREQKSPQMRLSHDSKNSIRVKPRTFCRAAAWATPGTSPRNRSSLPSPLSPRSRCRRLTGAGRASITFREAPLAPLKGERTLAATSGWFDRVHSSCFHSDHWRQGRRAPGCLPARRGCHREATSSARREGASSQRRSLKSSYFPPNPSRRQVGAEPAGEVA